MFLVGVSQTTHATEDAEDVDGCREDLDLGISLGNRFRCELKLERSIVDAGEVACTGRLVLFGLNGEGVHVDVLLGDAGVVLKGLDEAEVGTFTGIKTVVSVKLEVRADNSVGRTVGELVTSFGLCDNPDKLLNGVVEVQTVGTVFNRGFITGELELFDEKFVLRLGETLALIGVEVDVIDVQRHRGLIGGGNAIATVAEVGELGKGEVNLDFVVLKGNEGKSETVVAVEEKLKGDVKSGSCAIGMGDIRETTDHFRVEHTLLGFGCAEFGPDVEPFTVVTIDALATDFKFDLFEKIVTDVVVPLPTIGKGGKFDFENRVRDKITITAYGDGRFAAKTSGTVENLSDGFDGEVCVTTVNRLEESNFGVTCEVDILSAIGYELH